MSYKWAQLGSNQRPIPYEGTALTTELWALVGRIVTYLSRLEKGVFLVTPDTSSRRVELDSLDDGAREILRCAQNDSLVGCHSERSEESPVTHGKPQGHFSFAFAATMRSRSVASMHDRTWRHAIKNRFSVPTYSYSQSAACNHCRALPAIALDRLPHYCQRSRTSSM